MEHWLGVAEQLRIAGVSDRVRMYLDDGYASATAAARLMRQRYPEVEVVAALTVKTIGEAGHLDWHAIRAMHSWGVQIVGHGYQHVRLAAYRDGSALKTPHDGLYRPAPSLADDVQLSANEVLFQLAETCDALADVARSEFALPYGAYNTDVININDRHRFFAVISTADYGWDFGQELRPRLLVTRDLSPRDIPGLLAFPWPK
ncbi:MAG TPA: polysaccharide deacetylase family protein [Solirubrobacteraceae bacterium]